MTASIAAIFKSVRKPVAQAKLVAAYQNLFTGKGSREDADIVLVDLAVATGYFNTPDSLDHAELAADAGRRQIMGRIISHAKLPPEITEQLLEAVRLTEYTVLTEGDQHYDIQ
jgi:hypothetical protein